MPRHRKDITPEELAAFQARTKEKNKISQARASKKYAQTAPAKAYKKEYYKKNKAELNAYASQRRRERVAAHKKEFEKLSLFFETYKDQHPEFEPVA